jgi:hypothetical protein
MDGWFDRFKEWWRQGNAIALLTGERGLDEVSDERPSAAGPDRRDTGSGEACEPGDDPRTRHPEGTPADPAPGGQDVPEAGP